MSKHPALTAEPEPAPARIPLPIDDIAALCRKYGGDAQRLLAGWSIGHPRPLQQ
jgi:hypothetical protein